MALDAGNESLFKENRDKCKIDCLSIEVEFGVEINIYMIKPKDLNPSPTNLQPAYIYAHGGGAVFLTAK